MVGTGPGLGAARLVGKGTRPLAGDVAGGAVGSMTGGLAVDGVKKARGDKDVEMGWDSLVNGVTGATGGAAVHGANKHVPAGRSPNFAVEGPAQGVVYGGGRAIAKPLHDAIWPQEPNEPKPDGPKSESADTPQGPRKGSVKDVFG
ncbi:hypothetical protein [Streptomyces sp. NPDC039016]|uniref:hypothetical protein n=1 Tax=Streptomyces sp. NPDC039016 TaxID=3154330 RepID=UPI0033E3C78A